MQKPETLIPPVGHTACTNCRILVSCKLLTMKLSKTLAKAGLILFDVDQSKLTNKTFHLQSLGIEFAPIFVDPDNPSSAGQLWIGADSGYLS